MNAQILQGDSLQLMPTLAADSIDSIITDPPYGLSFMGKNWDKGIPGEAFWREALRVAKPGAHLLAFGGTRTYHRLACAIEDAGWEIRDCIMWVYGSGFPKSHDVSKHVDRALGATRQRKTVPIKKVAVINAWKVKHGGQAKHHMNDKLIANPNGTVDINGDIPVTVQSKRWQGWGTALKPAWEPIIVARKPLIGTVAQNVLAHGTGAINVDGCRVGTEAWTHPGSNAVGGVYGDFTGDTARSGTGRWPANVIHDGSDEVVRLFPQAPSAGRYKQPEEPKDIGARGADWSQHIFKAEADKRRDNSYAGDTGSAARFFYCAKASKADRDHNNTHPTVKPTALMRYLCRLVTPPNGTILDPFTGSGSTGKAAMLERFNFIGIELHPEYAQIAQARIEHAKQGATLQP